jgi:hypothetical protein
MSEYVVHIPGEYDLGQINAQILGEEASFSEFINSKISLHRSQTVNMARFRELPAGTIPDEMRLVVTSEAQPPGTVPVWTGVMVVNSEAEAVSAYRAT